MMLGALLARSRCVAASGACLFSPASRPGGLPAAAAARNYMQGSAAAAAGPAAAASGGLPEAVVLGAPQRQFASTPSDPERPKRPSTSWIRFLGDFRKQHQDLKGKEVMKTASAQWKGLSDTQKDPWEKPYLAARKAYEVEAKAYVDSGKGEQWKQSAAAPVPKRDPERPKKPLTAWLRYLEEFRARNPGLKPVTKVFQGASAAWKAMTEQQRAPFAQGYEAAKTRHAQELQAYKDSGKEAAWKSRKAAAEEAKGARKARAPRAPKPPAAAVAAAAAEPAKK